MLSTRIVEWVGTAFYHDGYCFNDPPRPISWCPIFAMPWPQFVFEEMVGQVAGKLRRARLCSSSQALQPY